MLGIIRKHLSQIIDDIDSGNSNLTEEEEIELIGFLRKFNSRDKYISKYQAYTYLNISRATFDNLVRNGVLPKGRKIEGFKELQWSLKEIKDYGKRRTAVTTRK